jgi:hypothetical protein
MRKYLLLGLSLLVLDWAWGMAQVRGLVPATGAAGLNKPLGVWCSVDGRRLEFTELEVRRTTDGGFSLTTHTGGTWLFMTVPKLGPGTYRLEDAPGLKLDFIRDITSSDSRASYAARSDLKGTRFEVKLTGLGGEEGILEGEFFADASSFPPGLVRIEQGKFRLKIPPRLSQTEPRT